MPAIPQTLAREYVSGGSNNIAGQLARALSWALDDITSTFGDDLYDRMLVDAQVYACCQVLKAAILETGVRLSAAQDDATDPDYDLAMLIRDEADAMLDQLEIGLSDVLLDLLDALAFGNRVAELRYELRPGEDGVSRLQLAAIKPKPRHHTAFVVDAFANVLGLLYAQPGMYSPALSNAIFDPKLAENILPREKFAILTWRPKNGDPRGTSILRAAYVPWWRKQQILPEHLRYLTQFAGPSVIAFTPEGLPYQPPTDALGNLTGVAGVTPEQGMLNTLVALRNGTVAVLPGGSKVQPLEMQGDGAAFLRALAREDQQITKAILTQELATEEGEHSTRAAAGVHQDVLDTLVRQGKAAVIRMLTYDVLRPWVRYNWGAKALPLVPDVSLGEDEERDRGPMWTGAAALQTSGYLHPSQLPQLDDQLGLPIRDLSADPLVPDIEPPAALPAPGVSPPPGTQPPVTPPASTPGGAPPVAPVPPGRVGVRAHTRAGRQRAVGMARKRLVTRKTAPDAAALWDRYAPPELRGLLKAEVKRG